MATHKPETHAVPEIRQDPITGRRVIIAPARTARPRQRERNGVGQPSICPFCSGNEGLTPPEVWADRNPDTLPDTPGWRVRIVPNKYPALKIAGDITALPHSLFFLEPSHGRHEVIVESPAHHIHVNALDTTQWENVLRGYCTRWRALQADAVYRYILIYKNQGERAGATLEHVHSQLIAMPTPPPDVMAEHHRARSLFDASAGCLYCEVIEQELRSNNRLVWQSERFVALCPFASRFEYETWILPKFHNADFAATRETDLAELSNLVSGTINRLDRLAAQIPFNLLLHSGPKLEKVDEYFHWRLEILPQLNRAAGFEWGTGMFMNPLAPEEAARLLRDAAR